MLYTSGTYSGTSSQVISPTSHLFTLPLQEDYIYCHVHEVQYVVTHLKQKVLRDITLMGRVATGGGERNPRRNAGNRGSVSLPAHTVCSPSSECVHKTCQAASPPGFTGKSPRLPSHECLYQRVTKAEREITGPALRQVQVAFIV